MIAIILRESTLALIEAHATPGVPFLNTSRPIGNGLCEVMVGEDVAESLAHIHADPDLAIRMLCSSGVGHG